MPKQQVRDIGELVDALAAAADLSAVTAAVRAGAPQVWGRGFWGLSVGVAACALLRATGRSVLLVTPAPGEAERMADDLSVLLGGVAPAYFFPTVETIPGEAVGPPDESVALRLAVLDHAMHDRGGPMVVVATPASAASRLPAPAFFDRNALMLRVGAELDLDASVDALAGLGYERVHMVEGRGEFSVRGGILDIFPASDEVPCRVELAGDMVDSIRRFSVATQRSSESLDFARVVSAESSGGEERAALLDYLPEDALIVVHEPVTCAEEDDGVTAGAAGLSDERRSRPRIGELLDRCRSRQTVFLSLLEQTSPAMDSPTLVKAVIEPVEGFRGKLPEMSEAVARWTDSGEGVVFASDNQAEAERLRELLADHDLAENPAVSTIVAPVHKGFRWPAAALVLLTDTDVFGRYRVRRRRRLFGGGAPVHDWRELNQGDFVVHADHGIGRYEGVATLSIEDTPQDFLSIAYREGDRLYVPLHQVDLVQKYIGSEGEAPDLYRLGGSRWHKVKAKAKKAVRRMAEELLRIHAARASMDGFAFSPDTAWQREFEASFIYDETDGQYQALQEVKRDMEGGKPMDRLICGDVGYGKTEVAARAAFKAVMDGKQVAMLVPTTILAQQHHTTFCDRMADYPVRVEVLSRFKTPAQQRRTVRALAKGGVDVVIGTHRLLGKDVQFHDLGLVIIDEEQRFGVAAKEKLKEMRALVDVLTLTATPIPRTLHMSLVGIRDMSTIVTPPRDRLPIVTRVAEYAPQLLRDAILRELGRGGQAFFVHNRVRSIEAVARKVRSLVPEARVGVAHGQMSERELERVMMAFLEDELDVLVCTTIVESGLDIPNVNTIIVNRADNFGLADLYQLRGRVGRFHHRAYAYFLIPPARTLTELARKRLHAIEEFTELGSGFALAMRDLEIRGAGNLLGPEQHGHIEAVGFDLYCRLLREAVSEMRGEAVVQVEAAAVELGVEARIPDGYVPDARQKLQMYRRMAAVLSDADADALAREMRDRFGPPPPPVSRLLDVLRLRMASASMGLARLSKRGRRIEAALADGFRLQPEGVEPMYERFGERVEYEGDSLVRVSFSKAELAPSAVIDTATSLLRDMASCAIVGPTPEGTD